MTSYGLNKTTLLDYPGHLAATIFTGGCNFCCPFCHNKDLVLSPASALTISKDELLSFLDKRKQILDGICITGGEPTLYSDLPELIKRIKEMGYQIKLDTNGTNPSMLRSLYEQQLLDYVAMDIKNSLDSYSKTAGISTQTFASLKSALLESVSLIQTSGIDYEFRTTVVSELHTAEDFKKIGQWIYGAKAYYLQSYEDSPQVIQPGFHPHSKDTLQSFVSLLKPYIENVELRGIQ